MGITWIGAISALLGSLLTALFSHTINRNQLNFQREKILLENNVIFNKEKLNRLSDRREELFHSLQNLRSGFSLTQNYRMDQANISSNEYDMHYEKMNKIALRAQLITYLYFPDLIKEINHIYELSNLIWGQQQNYFGYSKEKQQNRQKILDQIVEYSSDLDDKCSQIMKSLGELSVFYAQD